MITNNINKVKASKSPRDLHRDTEADKKSRSSEKGDGDKDGPDSQGPRRPPQPPSAGVSSRSKEQKARVRSRDDYRMARGGSVDKRAERGSFRGRGVYSRKTDREPREPREPRDGDTTFNSRVIKNADTSADSKSRSDLGSMVPEDCRISKLIRRLYREDDPEKFITICKQLQDALTLPENGHYIRRSVEQILESLLDVLHSGPGTQAKSQVATCLGHLGYALNGDFKRFADWLFPKYSAERNSDVRCLLLKALQEMLTLDAEHPRLKEFAPAIMGPMQNILEATDLPDLFVASVEVIMNLADLYPETLHKHFRDSVDILVGWLIDSSQSAQMTNYAAQSLQRLAPFWIQELNFSVMLLGQFLEDMEAYGEDFVKSLSPEDISEDLEDTKHPSTEDCIFKVEAFIKTFNTVSKALGPHLSPANSSAVTWGFLGDCLAKMLSTVHLVLDVRIDEDLIITANECAWLLLSHLQTKTTPGHERLYQMFNFLLGWSDQLGYVTQCSILHAVAKTVREVSANLPLELVQDLLGPKSHLRHLRFSPNKEVTHAVLVVYHALLNLKNIPLLQEAYRFVLGDLEIAYKLLVPSVNLLGQSNPLVDVSYSPNEAEAVVYFLFQALSDLANASNSIIGMWALKPSMLELFAVHLEPTAVHKHPALHYTLLYLLHSHCSRYNHYISSSSLAQAGASGRKPRIPGLPLALSADVPVSSPTSLHLTNLLVLLQNILLQDDTIEEVDLLVLLWVQELLEQAGSYLPTLVETTEFLGVLRAVVVKGHSSPSSSRITISVGETMQILLSSQGINWQPSLLIFIMELCLVNINSTNMTVATLYSHLMAVLPWNVSLPLLVRMNHTADFDNHHGSIPERLRWAHRVHLAHNYASREMSTHSIREFMNYILRGSEKCHRMPEWLVDMFSSCWLERSAVNNDSELPGTECAGFAPPSLRIPLKNLNEVALHCHPVLLQWAAWQAAQLCVSSKLRTLGKPQETFTKIEDSIKSLARETGNSQDWDVCRVRLLLDFLEQLEKVMYNAADGTAVAITAPCKPVRTFFHTNRNTCAEWLTRVRLASVVVALRAGQAAAAVRQGQALLQYLHETSNTNSIEFERAVLYVGCALCRLHEWESITGLYVWCRDETARKFPILKALAEQASGKLEHAVEGFRRILSQDSESQPHSEYSDSDSSLRMTAVAADHLTECYVALQDWVQLSLWKNSETNLHPSNGGSLLLSCLTNKEAQALAEYEAGQYEAASRLLEWSTSSNSGEHGTWNTMKLIRRSHRDLTTIALGLAGEASLPVSDEIRQGWIACVERCAVNSQMLLSEGLRNTPSELVQEAAVLQYASAGLSDILHAPHNTPLLLPLLESGDMTLLNSGVLSNALWWSEYLEHMAVHPQQSTSALSELRIVSARVARKEGNPGLAVRLLARQLGTVSGSCLEELAHIEMRNEAPVVPLRVRALTEIAKLLHGADKRDLAVCLVAHGAQSVRNSDNAILQERGSRLLLTLGKWLQLDSSLIGNTDNNTAISCLLDHELSGGADLLDIQNCSLLTQNGLQVIPAADTTVGRLLRLAVVQCPQLAKSWAHFAAWCYRWGRRAVDAASEAGGQLSAADRACVQAMLPPDASAADLDSVLTILGQTRALADEEDIDMDSVNTSEMMEAQLHTVGALRHASSETLGGLVGVWREAQQRVYNCYQLSAMAYFKFLQLCGQQESCVESCATVTASLRLLRLVVKHALELQSVLEAGLTATPTAPWKAIIPQLFSRLGHPEPYVRRRVAELLCRLAEDAPHLITFPAVVGAASGGARLRHMPMPSSTARLFSTCLSPAEEGEESLEDEEEEEDEDEEEEEENSASSQSAILKNCFLAMVDTLSKQAPEAIAQVQQLVCELRRITLLWDELWLGTLSQHQSEIARRVTQLDAEISRVDTNPSLSPQDREKLVTEKYRIILKPLVFIFEQLHAITAVTPETPHERWFQEKFGACIEQALARLKEPTNPRRPQDWWLCLKQLQQRLNHRMNKRAAYSLRMEDVSPALAALKNTHIAMPGVASQQGRIVTIASVHSQIAILPTKTKPKKLLFHGSDGKTYTYLFKGLEDLHLDERIMQLLHIANTMLRMPGSENTYRARHYSVIPLGPRSGLISWVDNVTPLFGLYKRWQQREACAVAMKNGQTPGAVMRPSELFYQKLSPRLKEKGVSLDNRKEWPLATLREVLQELMAETPSHLLSKELWCHSANAGAWWQTQRTYSHSVAVMSVIGYIIGLGDRHLDNVLVDLSTGEVVHIDYNVCFEKGKTLRVPEKVPFRMTPNIQAALGVTGVEGIFRLACEHVLKVMKKGRETLLTLLEAFVYDPLIDWTTGNEAGYAGAVYGGGQAVTLESKQSRKELEREVTRAMFAIRVMEMRADWLANRDQVIAVLGTVSTHLEQWLEACRDLQSAQEQLQDCHSLLALVKEAEVQVPSRTHPLYTLPHRYSGHRQARDAQEAARKLLRDKLTESDQKLQQYKVAVSCLRGPQLAQLSIALDQDGYMVFDLVKEFLQNAGQGQMVFQCEQSESEMGGLAVKQARILRSCIDVLSQYGAVCGLFPTSYVNKHRVVCYQRWASMLLQDLSIQKCQEVVAEFGALMSPPVNGMTPKRQQVINFAFGLQNALSEANIRLQKCYSMLRGEACADARARLDNACMEAEAVLNKLRMGEPAINIALECVAITALAALNKRFLMMEGAAAGAGECLVDLTSRDGEWFLDDMCLLSGMIVKMCSLLQAPAPDSQVNTALQCLVSVHGIYRGLQELNVNFASIILPEAVVALQTQEPSVLAMVADLNQVIDRTPVSLPELLDRLNVHLSCIAIGVESPHNDARQIVADLRGRLDILLQQPSNPHGSNSSPRDNAEGSMSAGQMLLMGFNGLFEKLQLDGHALAQKLASIHLPPCWKNVDHIRESKAFSASVFDEATRSVLEDVFLVKRLQTIREFFRLCSALARNFRGDMPEPGDPLPPLLMDEDRLSKPVRRFTADYASRQMLGVMSHTLAIALCLLLQRTGLNVSGEVEQRDIGAESKVPLDELCHKAVELCCGIRNSTLQQVSAHVSALEATWRRREVHNSLATSIDLHAATVQRLQVALTSHNWLHDTMLQGVPGLSPPPFNRAVLLRDLQRHTASLLMLQPRIVEARERQSTLIASVEQRLKWAAGANPALSEVMAAFACAVQSLEEQVQHEQKIAALMASTCNAVLHHEAMRAAHCPEGLQLDTAFLQLVDQCEQSCNLASETGDALSPAEESLVHMLPIDGPVDRAWIHRAEVIISENIKVLQKKMVKMQEMVFASQDCVKTKVSLVRSQLAVHNRLMSDVRTLIRSMAKFEEGALVGLADYLVRYRAYSERLCGLTRQLTSENLEMQRAKCAIEQIQLLIDNTGAIYEDLLGFAGPLEGNGDDHRDVTNNGWSKRPPLLRQDSVCLSPRKGVPNGDKEPSRDPHTGKAVQERNAYAMSVWRRVRMKLEGRDPDPSRRTTVTEQVDFIIEEATNLDNLALLYEGWTPWV